MVSGRRRLRSTVVGCALLVMVAGAFGPSWARTEALPSNVHPAVAQTIRSGAAGTISVIISTALAFKEDDLLALGGQVTARFPFIHALAVDLPAGQVAGLASLKGVRAVLPDSPVMPTNTKKGGSGGDSGGDTGSGTTGAVNYANLLNSYNHTVRAPYAWDLGFDGKGVTVAVVDSGLPLQSNSDLGARVLTSVRFNSSTSNLPDLYGHGTHVGTIVGGDGRNGSGKYIGIAPGVNLINVKFSDDQGRAAEKDLVNALQWVYENRSTYNIRVVNISAAVGTQQSYKESATAAAVEQLWLGGVVVVVSAGNRGTEKCAVCYAPASDPYVITVGAVDDLGTSQMTDDTAATWSSRGTTLDGHSKPEVMAPGNQIVAYMPTGSLRTSNPGNAVDNNYFRMGGTSMSAPVVSGAVALLLQKNPSLTPDQVKWLLMNTTRTYRNQPRGTPGIIDLQGAFQYNSTIGRANQGLTPSPMISGATGTIDFGSAYWSNAYWSNAYWSNSLSY